MATNSLLSEEQLRCPICLDVFNQPVSTPCGHNFCMPCISNYWDTRWVCQCPVCKETFESRPDLKVNTFISGLASQFMSLTGTEAHIRRPVQNPASCGSGVLCDVCTDTQQTAVKSCLECVTSYCAVHLEHYHRTAGLKRHTLLEPMSNLEDRICKEHTRFLTKFCKMENVLLCDVCFSSQHSNPYVISVEQACEEKKAMLEDREAEVEQMKEEGLEKVEEIEELVETTNVTAESVTELTQLVSEIQQSQAALIRVIEEKQRAAVEQAGGLLVNVKQEVNELERTSAKISELKETEDHLYLLLNMPKTDPQRHEMNSLEYSCNIPVEFHRLRKYLSITVPRLQKLLLEMNAEIEELSSEPNYTYLKFLRQYVVDVSLDPNTAHPQLVVSDDRKHVQYNAGTVSREHQNPNRFTGYLSVLGDTALSTYKFYFEVYVAGKTEWLLGMAKESIQRNEEIPRRPGCGLWAIWFKEDRFETFCNPNVPVHHGKVERVGVFVRYETNSIHFYDVQTITEMHVLTDHSLRGNSFGMGEREKLYPFLNPCGNENSLNWSPMSIIPVKKECLYTGSTGWLSI